MWSEVISVGDLTQTRSWSLRISLRGNWSCIPTFWTKNKTVNCFKSVKKKNPITCAAHQVSKPALKVPAECPCVQSTFWIHVVVIQSCSPGPVTLYHYSRFGRRENTHYFREFNHLCRGLTDRWLQWGDSTISLMWRTERGPVLLLHCTQNGEEGPLSGPAGRRSTNTVLLTRTVSMFSLSLWTLRQDISCWWQIQRLSRR